ncbi:DUF4351 domain-containing protein [Limnofasciculus baicalensis]|uniref:DUF4351 domain-containing protein n=1 Tax=Limnofasciculus baicalensis TaxID=3064906 RepID=UPI0028153E4C|nr:DUF4351 domain-containing protein [Limnofasciculus baicalensis]
MSYDNTCKYLAEKYPTAFANWLLGIQSSNIEILKTELTNEPIRADAITFLRTANQILHLEFQTLPYSDPPMPLRMLDYSVRLKRQYRCEVEQVVIFLQQTTSEVVFTQEYRDRNTSHHYRVIRLWEQNPALFLANPGLLPLATLTQTDSPETLLTQVAEQIATISDREQQQTIASCTQIFAGLRFEKNLIRQLFREEIMQGSVIYQDILQQGVQRGQQQGEAIVILRQLNRRLGTINPILQEQIRGLSTFLLEELAEALLDFFNVEDLVTWLRRKDPRQAQVSLIIRLLNRRLGEVELSLINRVQRLSIEQVESLGEALLDFSEVTDLVKWLDELEQQEE